MTETAGLGRMRPPISLPGSRTMYRNWASILGLKLELESEEAPVGTLSLDLLARDTGTNRAVIIENQLEPTDHDHLGKLLTYAGDYDANVIVWVAQNIRDEHR